MKNNINFKNYNRNIKYKLVFVSLTSTLITAACNQENNAYENVAVESNYVVTSYPITNNNTVSNTTSKPPEEVKIEYKDISYDNSLKVNLNESEFNNFINYLDTFNTKYNFEHLYDFDTAINKLNEVKNSNNPSNIKEVTKDEFYNIVSNNNKEYIVDHGVFFKNFSSDELKQYCNIVYDTINNQIGNSDLNKDNINYKLNNIKILISESTFNYGVTTNDYCILINPNMISDEEHMKSVLAHEAMHIIQKESPDFFELNPNIDNKCGISIEFKDIAVNSLNFNWLAEASAEKNMNVYRNVKPTAYENYIKYMNSISLASLPNPNFKAYDTENLMYKHSLDDLYNYFNVSSDKDKREVLNMMYTFEVVLENPKDFYEAYSKYYDYEVNDKTKNIIREHIIINSYYTLNKNFYKNLAICTKNNDVSLNDIYYLIDNYENSINKQLYLSNANFYELNHDLVGEYVDIQDNFFYALSKSTGIDEKTIIDGYINYTENNKTTCDLSWLDNDKKEYLENIVKENTNDLSSIRAIQLKFEPKYIKK